MHFKDESVDFDHVIYRLSDHDAITQAEVHETCRSMYHPDVEDESLVRQRRAFDPTKTACGVVSLWNNKTR